MNWRFKTYNDFLGINLKAYCTCFVSGAFATSPLAMSPLTSFPFHVEDSTDYLEKTTATGTNFQLSNESDEPTIYKIMRFLRLENPYLFPSFYEVDKKEKFDSFCEDRGCMNKIRMKREATNIMNKQETSEIQLDQKRHFLQNDEENTRETFAKKSKHIVWFLYLVY